MTTSSKHIGSLSPEYALLGLLAQQPDHGYELHQRLVANLGGLWHISLSQVYNILKRLEKEGFITGSLQEQDKLPNRFLYHVTPAGRSRFEAWLQTPTAGSVRAIRIEFITRLYFASQRDRSFCDALIDAQKEEIRKTLVQLQKNLDQCPPEQVFNHLGLELRINQLSSLLGWLEKSRTLINSKISK